MGTNNFKDWFEEIMGFAPYGYQERYATEKELPQLLSIPTGAGKTATILMGWLWRRLFAAETIRENTPRRLIYCLPICEILYYVYSTRKFISLIPSTPISLSKNVL
jgi:CRISPR-associated endonuclease/helicase Cas3